MFIGNRISFQKVHFDSFFMESVFFNPKYLKLKKSVFNHGIGSIVYSDYNKKILSGSGVFTPGDYDSLSNSITPGGYDLYTIADCNFRNINFYTQNTNYIINLNSKKNQFTLEVAHFNIVLLKNH